jgi:D-lactate dehydrogenase
MGASGKDEVKDSLIDVTLKVLKRAGYNVVFPEHMGSLCCGTPWESKGFTDVADMKSAELEKELLKASNNGEFPVLCDTSPCVYRMKKTMDSRIRIYEPVEFACEYLLDKLPIQKIAEKTAFHITCSSTKMDLEEKFLKVAAACVENPVFPIGVGCCGFAGDKGFSIPELNEWALRNLREEVRDCGSGVSNSKTCEIGLSEHSGINYRSVMYLLDRCSSNNYSTIPSGNEEKVKHEHS